MLIIGELPVHFGGGGSIRNEEILKRFKGKLDFEFIPSVINIRNSLYDNNYREILIKKIHELKLNVPYEIINIIDSNKQISTLKIINKISNVVRENDIIYSQADVPEDLYLLSKLRGTHKGFLIQGIWFFKNLLEDVKTDYVSNIDIKYNFIKYFGITIKRSLFRNFVIHYLSKKIDFINTVNPYVPEFTVIKNRGITKNIVYPGNAIDECTPFSSKKENYIIYPARTSPTKGFLLLPFIFKKVVDKDTDLKLYLTVNKDSNFPYKERFLKLIRKFGIENNIEFLGFQHKKRLFEYISRAWAVLIPSLIDSYSLAILESLCLNTIFIGLNIPTLNYLYNDLKPVILANSLREISDKIISIYKMKDEDYKSLFLDKKIQDFINLHKDWNIVAEKELYTFTKLNI